MSRDRDAFPPPPSAALHRDAQSPPDPSHPPDASGAAPTEVRIAYAPEHDGAPDPGEVVWAWVPYEDDPSQGKDRPVVVIGTAGEDLAVIPLSSRDHSGRRDRDEWVELGAGAWDGEGRVSYANVDRLLRVAERDVRREGSVLGRPRFDRLVAAVAELHRIVLPG